MTPRPLYRWKSLWLGFLVLGFLGWSWVRSMDQRDAVDFGLGVDLWRINATFGRISAWRNALSATGEGIHSIRFRSEPSGEYMHGFPPAYENIVFEEYPRVECWRVADWFVMLLFLALWVPFLVWRWWRQRILTKNSS